MKLPEAATPPTPSSCVYSESRKQAKGAGNAKLPHHRCQEKLEKRSHNRRNSLSSEPTYKNATRGKQQRTHHLQRTTAKQFKFSGLYTYIPKPPNTPRNHANRSNQHTSKTLEASERACRPTPPPPDLPHPSTTPIPCPASSERRINLSLSFSGAARIQSL